MPRAAMADIALRYPGGLKIGSFEKSDVPFAAGAYRLENGVRMAGPGCTFRPPSCEDMRGQQIPTLAGIEAHVVAVDEENGTVLLWMDFGPGSLPGPPGAEPRSLVTSSSAGPMPISPESDRSSPAPGSAAERLEWTR